MEANFAFASARISAASTVEVCLSNVDNSAHDPAAINVVVAVYIP
jgi:hypothetical protein